MNGAELTKYRRRCGVYPGQIAAWRQACKQAAVKLSKQDRRLETLDAKAQRDRIRELEWDLRRHNAALAETAASLALSKKARVNRDTGACARVTALVEEMVGR